jgi:hypothetical protein
MAAQGTENKGVELAESGGQLEWARNAKRISYLGARESVLLEGFVVGVAGGFKEEDGGDAAGHLLDVANFVLGERAAEERLFGIGEPFFDDLISAYRVLLTRSGILDQ